ncbi:uncharacterized protein LOC144826172 [Lissotriton helveticus]
MVKQQRMRVTIAAVKLKDGSLILEEEGIAKRCQEYYSKLYASREQCSEGEVLDYLEHIKLPFLTNLQREFLMHPIEFDEIWEALSRMRSSRAPGIDGLTAEFYKSYLELLLPHLSTLFSDMIESGQKPRSMREALIVAIPKPDKPIDECCAYRPLSLLNVDTKIYAKVLATRLALLAPVLVAPEKARFIAGRNLTYNLQTVFGDIQHTRQDSKAIAIFLDMEKAFDSVEWSFMRAVLTRLGLGQLFVQMISVLYNDPVAHIRIGGKVTDPIRIGRGTRQGCPLSPTLYALIADPLACAMREYHVHRGLNFPTYKLVITTYADDTLLYVRDPETNLAPLLREVVRFGALSGLKVNWDKSLAFPLTETTRQFEMEYPLRWTTDPVRYLGNRLHTDAATVFLENYGRAMDKLEDNVNKWIGLPLSLLGRITIMKMIVLPREVFQEMSRVLQESKQLLKGGDIAVKLGRSAMICKDDSCFWPKSSDGAVNVPYTLSGYSGSEVASFTDAISEFAALTCIRFVDRTTETDYLQIAPRDGCWSFMGRAGGPQPLSLIGGCLARGSIQHELNHALGFHHEQSRSDRDEYVRIITENISDGNLANFNKENTNNLGLEYDYSSIMHYGRYAFTKTSGQATIVPIKNPNAALGQTVGLSNLDLAKINRLYNCDMCSTISRVGFGFLNSTNYPSHYPSNTDCSYLIRVNVAKILLTFTAFDIESSPNCESDYVRVYDGMTKDSPVLLNKACGRGSVPPLVSSTNVMLLQFVTNGAISASGFNAYYQNIVCAQSYSTSPGTVTSENYPQNYPASLDCGYYISAPSGNKITLKFTDFDLEPSMPSCHADYLVIFNGPTNKDPLIGRYCGSGPVQSVVSSGNSLLLQFHSDSSVQEKGFQATYTFGKLRSAK